MDYRGLHRAPVPLSTRARNFGSELGSNIRPSWLVISVGFLAVLHACPAPSLPAQPQTPPTSERANPQTQANITRIEASIDRFLAANAATFQPNIVCAPDGDSRTCARYPGKSEDADLSITYQDRSFRSDESDWRIVEIDLRQPDCMVSIVPTDSGGYELDQYDNRGHLSQTTLGNTLSPHEYSQLEGHVVDCLNDESSRQESAASLYIRD